MTERDWLAACFDAHRGHLRAAAYRMLGSLPDADDAVQEAWLRLRRAPPSQAADLRAWLTTVVARVCVDELRARLADRARSRRANRDDPVVRAEDAGARTPDVALGDSIGLALFVVLDSLTPAERLAFLLHDVFGLPFDEIGPILQRTPAAARTLASRARHRIRDAPSARHTSRSGRVYWT